MKVLLHDYCGHPFQLQLAEALARRGMEVDHLFCGSIPTTPQAVKAASHREGTLRSRAISLDKPIAKGAFVERFMLERSYGRQLHRIIVREQPDIVVMANTPIDALAKATDAAASIGKPLVVWVQDLLGEAALRILPAKLGPLGTLVGRYYRGREDRLLARAQFLVSITDAFAPVFRRAGVPDSRWATIPNWAPLDKITLRDKVNPWSLAHGVEDKVTFLYSGTLGFKHNPKLILGLARALRGRDDAVVVVNSEGDAADWLREISIREGLEGQLQVNGFQPFDQLSDVLGAADVLLAILESDAGEFSVPSKVLSNLCAARPQLLAVPASNLSARIVRECEAGIVCSPDNEAEFVRAGLSLLEDAQQRQVMGRNGRRYAEQYFDIEGIADRFESVFRQAASNFN